MFAGLCEEPGCTRAAEEAVVFLDGVGRPARVYACLECCQGALVRVRARGLVVVGITDAA